MLGAPPLQLRESLNYSGKGKKSFQLSTLTPYYRFYFLYFFIPEICPIYILLSQNQLGLVGLNLSAQSMCNLKGAATEVPNGSSEILLKVS